MGQGSPTRRGSTPIPRVASSDEGPTGATRPRSIGGTTDERPANQIGELLGYVRQPGARLNNSVDSVSPETILRRNQETYWLKAFPRKDGGLLNGVNLALHREDQVFSPIEWLNLFDNGVQEVFDFTVGHPQTRPPSYGSSL